MSEQPTTPLTKGAALREGISMSLWDAMKAASENCAYPADYLMAIEEHGYRLIPWKADLSDHTAMGALTMLVDAMNSEPSRPLNRTGDEHWSQWFNELFVPAWAYALIASGRHKSDPSLRHYSKEERAEYLDGMASKPPAPSEGRVRDALEMHSLAAKSDDHCGSNSCAADILARLEQAL